MRLNDRKNLFDQADSDFIRFFLKDQVSGRDLAYYNADSFVDKSLNRLLELFPDEMNKNLGSLPVPADWNL